MVVGEDRLRDVAEHAVLEQVLGRPGDRVGRIVDADVLLSVGVGGDPVHLLGGQVDRGAAPGVPGRPGDADLHRARRAEGVPAAVHAGQLAAAVVALDLADAGQDDPGHAVLGPVDLNSAR